VSGTETKAGDRLSLEIPLDPAHMLTARLFAGGVARSLELGDENAEVLRLILTEICSEAIDRRREGRIFIDLLAEAGSIRVSVIATGVVNDETLADPIEASFRRTLIEALAPDASFVDELDRLTVSFTL
jgi:anti-sigma regulatory factor (Ser/Thr protein kinase)